MKEENNAAANAQQPSEAEMNDRYQNDWLNFHADAQQAKQDLNRRYAKMVNTFGSYKNMPDGVKEILKDDYTAHEAKWKENGEEMQKRFGSVEPDQTAKSVDAYQKEKQEFVQQLQQQQSRNLVYERT